MKPAQPRPTSLLGQQGEAIVASYLKTQGYLILERNYRQPCGEIDLIARRGEVLAFVEIKTRRHEHFSLSLLVNHSKQRKIIATARAFVASRQPGDCVLRFDVATLLVRDGAHELSYLPNAFTAPYW